MKERKISNWNNLPQNHILLFFSQLVEELLFYYTVDSFKLPAHNINTLLSEAQKTLEHINAGILKDGSFDPIRHELVDVLGKDKVATNILGEDIEILVSSLVSCNREDTYNYIRFIQTQLLNDYLMSLISSIREKIINNDAINLVRMTKSLLIELIRSGFSIDYINLCNHNIFYKLPVNDISSYNDFLECFSKENSQYTVIFSATTDFLEFSDYIDTNTITISSTVDIPANHLTSQSLKDFSSRKDLFCHVKIKARDHFKAFSKARFTLENMISHVTFLKHQGSYSFSKDGIIYFDQQVKYSSGQNNPILRRPDSINPSIFKKNFNIVISSLMTDSFDENSKQRLNLAYHRHLSSIRSFSYENQLVDLWSGVEFLLPIQTKDSTNKINQIIDCLLPIITYDYLNKIIYYIFSSISNSHNRKNIFSILRKVDTKTINALTKCLCLEQYLSQYAAILSELTSYPLLYKRIEHYHSLFSNQQETGLAIKNHQKRVAWQIQRIYRARNLIVHSGKTPFQLETLIENLHFYFDILIGIINKETSNAVKQISLDYIFIQYKFRNEKLLKYLQKNKKGNINEQFFDTVFLGN